MSLLKMLVSSLSGKTAGEDEGVAGEGVGEEAGAVAGGKRTHCGSLESERIGSFCGVSNLHLRVISSQVLGQV